MMKPDTEKECKTKHDIFRENHDAIMQIVKEFPRPEAEEIIARIFFGESVDSAIQSVICKF